VSADLNAHGPRLTTGQSTFPGWSNWKRAFAISHQRSGQFILGQLTAIYHDRPFLNSVTTHTADNLASRIRSKGDCLS
jgi:hypothetical protein